MKPKFVVGQKVIITPVAKTPLSPRDSQLEQFIGQSGEVSDYYWVSFDRGTKAFYIYSIRVGSTEDEIVLHEDELQAVKIK